MTAQTAITKTAEFFIGAVFGLALGLAASQLVIFTTIGAATHNARVEQYEMDRAIFYGDKLGE